MTWYYNKWRPPLPSPTNIVSQKAAQDKDVLILLKWVNPAPKETKGSLSGAQNVDLASKFQMLLGLGEGDRESGPYVEFIPIGWLQQ